MKLTRTSAALCSALAATAIAIAGCGGDDDKSSSAGGDTAAQEAPAPTPTTDAGSGGGGASTNLQVAADESGALKFDKAKLEAKAGNVTITMDNPSSVPHAVGIEGNGVDEHGETVGQGEKSTVTAELKAGEYEFYCPVDGHAEAGMKGPLTVK
jgi:plastocyanin